MLWIYTVYSFVLLLELLVSSKIFTVILIDLKDFKYDGQHVIEVDEGNTAVIACDLPESHPKAQVRYSVKQEWLEASRGELWFDGGKRSNWINHAYFILLQPRQFANKWISVFKILSSDMLALEVNAFKDIQIREDSSVHLINFNIHLCFLIYLCSCSEL